MKRAPGSVIMCMYTKSGCLLRVLPLCTITFCDGDVGFALRYVDPNTLQGVDAPPRVSLCAKVVGEKRSKATHTGNVGK